MLSRATGATTPPIRMGVEIPAAEYEREWAAAHPIERTSDRNPKWGRQILMFARLARRLNFNVATFQHILEGYKVADAMVEINAGGSSFSDWWAYKFEVYDAIPYNGAMTSGWRQHRSTPTMRNWPLGYAKRLNLIRHPAWHR